MVRFCGADGRNPAFVLQVAQQEQQLVQRREEHQTAVSRVEEVREEERRLQSRVQVGRNVTGSEFRSSLSERDETEETSSSISVMGEASPFLGVLQHP